MPDHDAVDRITEQWARERPDLDTRPMGVIGRLHRVGALLDARLRSVFAEAGLGNGDFDVLATLRRAGAPYVLSPSEISASSMVTTGAVTKRVDRLLALGLVERRADEGDGRSRPVGLTTAGLSLVDRLVEQHLANEDRLLRALEPADRTRLTGLLRSLLLDLEGPLGPDSD